MAWYGMNRQAVVQYYTNDQSHMIIHYSSCTLIKFVPHLEMAYISGRFMLHIWTIEVSKHIWMAVAYLDSKISACQAPQYYVLLRLCNVSTSIIVLCCVNVVLVQRTQITNCCHAGLLLRSNHGFIFRCNWSSTMPDWRDVINHFHHKFKLMQLMCKFFNFLPSFSLT